MRIIKNNTAAYEAFNETLPSFTKTGSGKGKDASYNLKEDKKNYPNKYLKMLHDMLAFERNVKAAKDFQQASNYFNSFLKNILPFKEACLFFFDSSNENEDKRKNLIPVSQTAADRTKFFVNRAYVDHKLDAIFRSRKPGIIPDPFVHNIDGSKSFYLIIPVLWESIPSGEENKSKGIFSILISSTSIKEDSFEISFIQMGLAVLLAKIDLILKQHELKNIYGELQLYQSKLANDYKLSAIGELTGGIVEDILAPLQVITSTIEMLRGEENNVDEDLIDSINAQVKKVKTIINRLVNFASVPDGKLKVQPCSINKIINNFYNVVNSSLQSDNYECVLDLEENIPAFLSHPNYINQLLSNIFSMIKAKDGRSGGIFVQTKYRKGKVMLKVLSTDYMIDLVDEDLKQPDSMNTGVIASANLRIIKNIMAKHEGNLNVETDEINGTIIQLEFPLKRKSY